MYLCVVTSSMYRASSVVPIVVFMEEYLVVLYVHIYLCGTVCTYVFVCVITAVD